MPVKNITLFIFCLLLLCGSLYARTDKDSANISCVPTASTTNVTICQAQLPYKWNGNTYNSGGSFVKLLTNVGGCDSIASLNLSVNAVVISFTRVTICASQLPYTWNNNSYNAAGIYNVELKGTAGCDSIATLNLKVIINSSSMTDKSVCASALPYVWNGNSYDSTGSYTKTFKNAVGCDSLAILNLTVNPIDSSISNIGICSSALPYTWNGNSYSSPGSYIKKLTSQAGCDSIATLNLSINPVDTSTTNVNLCPLSFPYNWNGSTYTTPGTYMKTLLTSKGCDSVAILILNASAPGSSTLDVDVCPPELPYYWNGNAYHAAGTYTKAFTTASGCDSVAKLNLAVTATLKSTTNTIICPLELPYGWNGNTYTTAGQYTKTLQNAVGCDSIATFNLLVVSQLMSTTNTTACAVQLPYVWNGNSYSVSGTYTKALVNAAGCDSIATLNLTVNPPVVNSTTNVSVCSSSVPYIWNGSFYTKSGTYSKNLFNAAGCDSMATLILTVNPNTLGVTNATICSSALPYTWNGTSYTTNGLFVKNLTSVSGCDSVDLLNLIINAIDSSTTDVKICAAQVPYTWNGNSYSTSGSYTKNFINAAGCDSVANLNLTVNAVVVSRQVDTVCESNLPYTWNGNTYNSSGLYNVLLKGFAGCDSIARLNLTVLKTPADTVTISVCASALPYIWNGMPYNLPGFYNKIFNSATACDSVATLFLTVDSSSASVTDTTICPAQLPFIWNGNSYNVGGIYTKTFINSQGCDSVATLNLVTNTTLNSLEKISVCPSALPYKWNNNSYNSGGTYTKTFKSAGGCDSVATLILTVNPNTSSITNAAVCFSALPYKWNGSSYNIAGTYTKTLINATGCDSMLTLILTVNAATKGNTYISVCASALPYMWNGNSYNIAGSYITTLVNAAGCDSVATLNLFVLTATSSTSDLQICPSQLPYLWNGNYYNASGSYTKKLINANGCDSLANLNLSVNSVINTTTTVSVCASTLPYTWNGIQYSASGTYTKSFTSAGGCDSVATLVLKVNMSTVSTTNISVCTSALPYVWNGSSYNATGTYTKTLMNAGGCDSNATLILKVNATSNSINNVIVCQSALPYVWNGNSYNAAGTYTKILTNSVGCDSVTTINLQVVSVLTSTTNKSVCESDLPYVWNGNPYHTAGTYNVLLQGASGCDSIAILVLKIETLQPKPFLGIDTALCPNITLTLSPGNFSSYLWQDMSTSPVYTVSTPGTYSVIVSNNEGCTGSAKVSITYIPNCDDLYFPNAITPNGDGLNDKFGALGDLNFVNKYSLYVYNRFGELVFSTTNPAQRWNGMFKGNPVDPSTFVWYSTYTFNGKTKTKKGYVFVIR